MANKILFISCALFCAFLLLFSLLPESVWSRAHRGERGTAITRVYATLSASPVASRTHTRHLPKSAMGCKENMKSLQPEGRLGLQVFDFPSSSFHYGFNVSPCRFVLAKVKLSGHIVKYRCTISTKILQQPSSFFLNALSG